MRISLILLALYLVVLSCIPCSDKATVCSADSTCTETTADCPDNTTDEHCSPFCACACCGCQVCDLAMVSNTIFAIDFSQKPSPIYQNIFTKDFVAAIWQPPKLVSVS